jgi:hypothetical protein
MAIVLRVAFNNHSWSGVCLHPLSDPLHYQCREKRVRVGDVSEDGNGFCTGKCWERDLCIKYRWESVVGNWGSRAYPGAKAYFVYRQPDGLYTLWGKSEVKQVSGKEIFFAPFEPMPTVKWVKDLTDRDIVMERWLQGFYRYVPEDHLERLIQDGKQFEEHRGATSFSQGAATFRMLVEIKPHIKEKLDRIASEEGREVEDVVREAIGEWLKGREKP